MALLLTGCVQKADWEVMQRQAVTPAGDLYAAHTVGQSFVARHDGLCAIEVVLVKWGEDSGRASAPLEVRLCRDVACQMPVFSETLSLETIVHNESRRFSFPPQPDSAGRTYFLLAGVPSAQEPARVTLWANSSDLYPDGSLLVDGRPAPGDLNFWTYYEMDEWSAAGRLFQQAGRGLGALPGLLLLLLAPGYLLARLLPRSHQDDPIDLLGLCLGLSMAVIPLLLLLLSQVAAVWTPPVVAVGGGLLGALAVGLFLRDLWRGRWRGGQRASWPVAVAMAGIVGTALILRAVHALDLVGPLWVDAVHHTLVARLIVERGAIPGDYLPYIPVAPATYHFGFQSLVAVLHGMTGLPLPQALLLLGQTLSGLAGLPLYVLGKRWGQSRWAGLGAALIPSALSLMPAYLISWSRYPEMLGLLILPVAVVLLDRLMLRRRWHWGLAAASAVAAAGTLVAHVRAAAFLAVLAGLLFLRAAVRHRYEEPSIAALGGRTLAVALAAVALVWPWLWSSLQPWMQATQNWPVSNETLSLYYILFGPGGPIAPWVVAGAALGWLWRREETIVLFLWTALLVVLANPAQVGLQPGGPVERVIPGLHLGGAVDDTAVAIGLYVPVSLAASLTCGGLARVARWVCHPEGWPRWLGEGVSGGVRRWVGRAGLWLLRGAGLVLLLALARWGAYDLREIVNPRTALLAPADQKAISWIEENTPREALFLINSYEWMQHVYAGQDGGYWIAPLTGRRTWPPPALYGLGSREYILEVNRVVREAMGSPDGETLYRLLRPYGFTHVYLGRYGGPLTPEKMGAESHFRLVYHEGGVWIFRLEPD